MTAIQFEIKKQDIVNELLEWFSKHSKDDISITFVKNSSAQFDENGIPYIDYEEQKEIEESLKDPECYEIVKTKNLSFEV
jgi:hypothetical protein